MADRNPRRDPRPGDILRGIHFRSWIHREVERVARQATANRAEAKWATYVWFREGTRHKHCTLAAWRQWAKETTIVKVGNAK